jgi:alanine dehydrogenase
VLVETGAGTGSAFPDADYEATGATIASVEEVWEHAELLLKV